MQKALQPPLLHGIHKDHAKQPIGICTPIGFSPRKILLVIEIN
jgi:hypothetical protein